MAPPPRLFVVVSVITLCYIGIAFGADECEKKVFNADSFVCVCNADHCDFPGDIPPPEAGTYTAITSSREELRFAVSSGELSSAVNEDAVLIHVNSELQYQTMFGFGGAFTDATGINVKTLTNDTQDVLIRSYFAPEGIQYDLCRIPIAGSDFSTRPYSYDDVEGDTELEHWALAEEDHLYKLPLIRRAIEVSDRELLLFGSPWSPPAWMKDSGKFNGSGSLLREMWQPYSNYFVKFVEAYEAEGAPMWGLTTQNEPMTGFDFWFPWNTCGWTGEDQRDWIKTNLGPTLEAAGMRRLKLMIDDHNRDTLPWYPEPAMTDPSSNAYLDGIALHWYSDATTGPDVMEETHGLWPDKFLLYTESCDGWNSAAEDKVRLGDWTRLENYVANVIDDMNHWSTGWVDWNMALDMQGGPNWANNVVDSPIIINKENNEFYKNPMFYGLGHFSKFILPGSKRVFTSTTDGSIWVTAVVNPDGSNAVVILNWNDTPTAVSVNAEEGKVVNLELPLKSVTTLLV